MAKDYTPEQIAAARSVGDVPGHYERLLSINFNRVDLSDPNQQRLVNDYREKAGLIGFWFPTREAVAALAAAPRILAITQGKLPLSSFVEAVDITAPYHVNHFTYEGLKSSGDQFQQCIAEVQRTQHVIEEIDTDMQLHDNTAASILVAINTVRAQSPAPGAIHRFCHTAEHGVDGVVSLTTLELIGGLSDRELSEFSEPQRVELGVTN